MLACIREYYDKDKNKYFKTGEQGFVWPVIEKGCSNPKSNKLWQLIPMNMI